MKNIVFTFIIGALSLNGFSQNGIAHYDTFKCQQPVLETYQIDEIESKVDIWLQNSNYALYNGDDTIRPHLGNLASNRCEERVLNPFNPIIIPIAWHVLEWSSSGHVLEHQIESQMRMLNDAFSDTEFNFILGGINYVDNRKWSRLKMGSTDEYQCKSELAVQPGRYLNLYTTKVSGSRTGWATLPSDFSREPELDGIVIHNETLIGGSFTGFNRGVNLVHLVGHWMGLHHTFQGGCNDQDRVADTPAQYSPTFGCPENRDSCPDEEGVDDVTNYMDHSVDSCRTQFTPCQKLRMSEQMEAFRTPIYRPF